MSDISPTPAKSGQSKNQVVLVAVLGVVLVLVLVFMVLKPFGGGDSAAPVTTPAVANQPAADAGAAPGAAASPSVSAEAAPAEPLPAPARGRNPFDPPR